jgi:hypothetical protein
VSTRTRFSGSDGHDVSPQATEAYNPERRVGRNLSKVHRELFYAEREKFKQSIDAIPIANSVYRLLKLQQFADKAEDAGELTVAMAALKQAAQDLGGVFTNNVNVSGQIIRKPIDLSHLDADKRDALRQLLDLTEKSE